MTFLQELLKFMGLEGRLHLDWISSAEAQKFVQVVTDFTEKIKAMGPTPLSGDLDLSAIERECEAKVEAESIEGG
jgi:F420-non-reducing hydrogenase iron-sulfur subunit